MRVLFVFGALVLTASPSFAQGRKPIESKGIEVRNVIRTSSRSQSQIATIFLRLANSNGEAMELRNIRCEFHQNDKLVKRFSIPRLTVAPGEGLYEAPQKIEASFNRALCDIGK